MSHDSVKEITDETFSSIVLESSLPFVLDLWAPWCGPCKLIAPLFEEMAQFFKNQVVFGSLNVDDNPQIAVSYSVNSIPTLLFFSNASVVERVVGLVSKDILRQKIQSLLK